MDNKTESKTEILNRTEEWRMVKEFEGYYRVSNCGRIKSLARISTHKIYGEMHIKEKILAQTIDAKGYVVVRLTKNKQEYNYKVHRLVAYAFLPKPLSGQTQVNHKDGVKHNNQSSNLEWCSQSENITHAVRTGLKKTIPVFGEQCSSSKLTENEVKEIRNLYLNSTYTHAALAEMYGVSQGNITQIINKKTWINI